MFKKTVDIGQAGDNLGLLLKGVTKKDVARGMVRFCVFDLEACDLLSLSPHPDLLLPKNLLMLKSTG